MPRLWTDTVSAHRNAVRQATLDATAALVAERGLASMTMSEIAERTGIGRATLYKYFPDVESILVAWHQRQIERHLGELARVAEREADPERRLTDVLEAYAAMTHHVPHGIDLAAGLHRGAHVADAHRRLQAYVRDLLVDAAAAGVVRSDVSADELATYCLHALGGAAALPSTEAVGRLVTITLDGLRPPR